MPSHFHPPLPPGEVELDAYAIQAWAEIKAQLARIDERLENLEERISEEREVLKGIAPLGIRQDWLDKGMTELKTEVKVISGAYSKAIGAYAVLSILGAMVLSGLVWALTHWGQVWAFISGGTGSGPPTH